MNLIKHIKRNSRSGNKANYFYYSTVCSEEHEDVKYQIYKKLRMQGYTVYCEPLLENGGRPDLLVISNLGDGYIIEIRHTEKLSRLEGKRALYPKIFTIIDVPVANFDINKWDL